MAALRPCSCCIMAPAASFNLRPSSWPPRSILLPNMQRRNISLAIRAHNGATNQPVNPDPEEGMSSDNKKKWEEIKKIAKGPPDMPFRQEIDKIEEYTKNINNTSILHLEATALSVYLCMIARNAVKLASEVMDCAVLARGTTDDFSLHTVKQTVQMFVCIIVNSAEDSYHKKVTKETIVSFLGGLEGVAAISYILVQDTLENHAIDSKDRSLKYSPEYDRAVDRARLEYLGKMKILKHEFMSAQMTDAYQILQSTLADAILCTKTFVRWMNAYRKWTLGHVPGRTRASDHGEPNK